jgi:hypothetical protein
MITHSSRPVGATHEGRHTKARNLLAHYRHRPKADASGGRFHGLPGHRRWPTWLGLTLVAAAFADGTPPPSSLAAIVIAMPLCYLLFGALRGELRRPAVLTLQLAGLLAFTAVALTALTLDSPLSHYVLAAGWLAHGIWDFAHHRTGRVVPRAWSEWCGVVDVVGAIAIVALA